MMYAAQVLVLFVAVFCISNATETTINKKRIFSIVQSKQNFENARRHCKSLGPGHSLATIPLEEHQQYLEERLIREGLWDTPVWIGGQYNAKEREITWVDEPNLYLTYGKWLDDNDKRRQMRGRCLLVNKNPKTYRWVTVPCTESHYFVCQRDITV